MKNKFKILLFLSFSIFLNSCSSDENSNENSNFVTIGNQIWQSSNLDVTTYRDGTPIPQVTSLNEWINSTTGAWCYYNNNSSNGPIYGKLYNWYAVAGIYDNVSLNNPALRKQLAPLGWHVPSDDEWIALINHLGGRDVAGGKMKATGTDYWQSPNVGATNESGFTGLPGGYQYNSGTLNTPGYKGYWWSSTEKNTTQSWYLFLFHGGDNTERAFATKGNGFSVRCIKD